MCTRTCVWMSQLIENDDDDGVADDDEGDDNSAPESRNVKEKGVVRTERDRDRDGRREGER